MGADYIVTDLHLRSRFELSGLHFELLRAGLFGGLRNRGSIWEATYTGAHSGRLCPVRELEGFLRIIEGLDGEAKEQWNWCFSRRFDFGFEASDQRHYSRWQIESSFLRRIADLNGDFIVTVYRHEC